MKWQFWRWRPKVSLCTFQILALFMGSLVLVYQRSTPWRAGMTLKASTYSVNSISFSGDSKKLLAGGADGFARVWDVDSGSSSTTIDLVHPVFPPDHVDYVVVPAVATGNMLAGEDIPRPILASEISPDGKRIAVADESGILTLCDTETGQVLSRDWAIQKPTVSVHFSPNSEKIAICSSVSPYNPSSGVVIVEKLEAISGTSDLNLNSRFFEVRSDSLSSAFFSKDGSKIVTTTTGGVVQVWDAAKDKVVAALQGDMNNFRSAVFSPDGTVIATSGKDSTVRLWTAYSGDQSRSIIDFDKDKAAPEPTGGRTWFAKPAAVMRGHKQYVLSSQFSPEGDRLATVGLDGSARVWGGRDGAALFTLTESGPWRSVAFAPDGNTLALAGNDGSIQLWNRRCSERWYGKLTLPEFWLMVLLIPALIWSLRRDQRIIPPTPVTAGPRAED